MCRDRKKEKQRKGVHEERKRGKKREGEREGESNRATEKEREREREREKKRERERERDRERERGRERGGGKRETKKRETTQEESKIERRRILPAMCLFRLYLDKAYVIFIARGQTYNNKRDDGVICPQRHSHIQGHASQLLKSAGIDPCMMMTSTCKQKNPLFYTDKCYNCHKPQTQARHGTVNMR